MSTGPTDKYRHELKYICSGAQLALIQNRISHILPMDIHAGQTGGYNIRSLYFDDCYDSCYFEKENGTDPREKFRIRIYSNNTKNIRLELKKKISGYTHKLSCPLTESQCLILMEGRALVDDKDYPPILQKLCLAIKTRLMKPKIIVEYFRIPYVCQSGNVRITLDENIMSSNAISRFLEDDIPKRPVLPLGQHIMEVKYDEFLPDYVHSSLQIDNLQQTALSKYCICRKYTL